MKSLAELDHLNLDPTAKKHVATLVQSLLDQAEHDAKLLLLKEAEIQEKNTVIQAKDAAIKAKDFKIEALTHELAHSRFSKLVAPQDRDDWYRLFHKMMVSAAAEQYSFSMNMLRADGSMFYAHLD